MQKVLGCLQERLAYSEKSMEDIAGEKEVNGLTQLLSGIDELQPRKVEEVIPDRNLPEDTYIIYPTGGYHPFYGVPNTLPLYQQKIWPCARRVKFAHDGMNNRGRSRDLSQLNCDINVGYPRIAFGLGIYDANGLSQNWTTLIHRLVGLAFIPNPEGKKNVMHINDDPTNYLIKNLKWGTHSENNKGKIVKRPDSMEDKYNNMVLQGVIKG